MILTLIRWAVRRYRKEKELTPRERVDQLLASLRTASAEELGGVLAVAMQAKKTLDTTRIIDVPFPVDILDGHVPLDDAALSRLQTYIREMDRFRLRCLAEGTILTASVARGIDTWIAVMLTLTLPAMAEGREIWSLLARGEANVESAYRFMVRRDLTDVEKDYLTYRPRIFIPS